MNPKSLLWWLSGGLLVVTSALPACLPEAQVHTGTGIRVSGPGDLYCLAAMLNQTVRVDYVDMVVSSDSIEELKKGSAEAVFLGRAPSEEEKAGLKDYIIALDAVCLIIDDNSYTGGIANGGGLPLRKTTGLKGISYDALRQMFADGNWKWEGEYFTRNTGLDPQSWLWTVDAVAWIPQPKPIFTSFVFPPGKFDTQTVIFNALGLNENEMLQNRKSFTAPKYDKEEEILSYEFNSSVYSADYGTQDFAFKVAFASRRVMTIAPQHVSVRVLSIDGIDPLMQPESVIDGSYKLCREIHVLVRDDAAPATLELVSYLTSAAGQAMLQGAGFLLAEQVAEA